ncbi:hypothetical protein ACJ72_02253 [Emergomyces africanus]|uniref:Uncharacterized protein n=1 Tax=Emergomyces africanus TaxID=1955775 RepID=A0A1B7P2X2_9EURO|nr:hypothetical protein ACJ72_02253 [Emergomyces africanus]
MSEETAGHVEGDVDCFWWEGHHETSPKYFSEASLACPSGSLWRGYENRLAPPTSSSSSSSSSSPLSSLGICRIRLQSAGIKANDELRNVNRVLNRLSNRRQQPEPSGQIILLKIADRMILCECPQILLPVSGVRVTPSHPFSIRRYH